MHKAVEIDFYNALKVAPGTLSPDPEKEELFGNKEADARWELTSTTPATLAGLLAVLSYQRSERGDPLTQ